MAKIKKQRTERIINLRKERRVSAEELARRLHVAPSTYRRYEAEATPWSLDILEGVARIFNVSADFLLYGVKEGNPYIDEPTAKILDVLSKCNEEDKEKIVENVEFLYAKFIE